MPGGWARRGRRDNGLVAQEYAVVGDLDPRIGEHLLDVLAAGGIAAYLQPATDLHPLTRTTTLPARPKDRLYADREFLATARDYYSQLTTVPEQSRPSQDETTPADDDAAFAAIVAGFDTTIDPTRVPWPDAEELDTSATAAADTETKPAPRSTLRRAPHVIDQGSLFDGLDTFGVDLPSEEDEGYTPPPAPPLPHISRPAGLAIVAIIAGIVLFFWPEILPVNEKLALFLAFSGVLSGFVTLIWRLRPGDEEEDDGDDGARV